MLCMEQNNQQQNNPWKKIDCKAIDKILYNDYKISFNYPLIKNCVKFTPEYNFST
jgi:hypothetical protein